MWDALGGWIASHAFSLDVGRDVILRANIKPHAKKHTTYRSTHAPCGHTQPMLTLARERRVLAWDLESHGVIHFDGVRTEPLLQFGQRPAVRLVVHQEQEQLMKGAQGYHPPVVAQSGVHCCVRCALCRGVAWWVRDSRRYVDIAPGVHRLFAAPRLGAG